MSNSAIDNICDEGINFVSLTSKSDGGTALTKECQGECNGSCSCDRKG